MFVVYEVVSDLILPVVDFASEEAALAYVDEQVADGESRESYEVREESEVPDYDAV